jgi:hypothetical protein
MRSRLHSRIETEGYNNQASSLAQVVLGSASSRLPFGTL